MKAASTGRQALTPACQGPGPGLPHPGLKLFAGKGRMRVVVAVWPPGAAGGNSVSFVRGALASVPTESGPSWQLTFPWGTPAGAQPGRSPAPA